MKLNRIGWVATVVVCVLLCTSGLLAQSSGTGALTGTVTDPSGAAIANATVTVTNNGNGQSRTVMTGADGVYKVGLLPPGGYHVKFEAPGFSPVEEPSIEVTVTETAVLDRSLAVGAQTQEVTVNAEVETVQTATSSLGTVVAQATVTDLPLATRNYVDLLAISTGANAAVNNLALLGKGFVTTSVNGTASAATNYQMDGVSVANWASLDTGQSEGGFYANIPIPNPDAIQEFKIQTSSYDAGYGRNAGANVNVVTKSGTNQFHGAAFEFFRNTDLNANDWFFKRSEGQLGEPNKQAVFNQNQYGGAFGGPIKKNKLFFFGSYEANSQKNGASYFGFSTVLLPPIPNAAQGFGNRGTCPAGWTVPTQCDAAAQAFISQLGADNCSSTGAQLTSHPGLQVTCNGSNINPVAINLLQLPCIAGTPTCTGTGKYFIPSPVSTGFPAASKSQQTTYSVPAIYHEQQFIENADFVINSKETLTAREMYSQDPATTGFPTRQPPGGSGQPSSPVPGSPVKINYPDDAAVVKLTSILTPNLVNEAYGAYQRFHTDNQNLVPFKDSQIGMQSLTADDQLTGIQIGQLEAGGNYFLGVTIEENQFEVGDQVSWSHGKHSVRFGGQAEHNLLDIDPPGLSIGYINFTLWNDFLIGRCAQGAPGCVLNDGSTSFADGNSESAYARGNNGGYKQIYLVNQESLFVQDDLNLTSRLTVNVGVRWEYDGYPATRGGGWSGLWPSLINTQPIPGNSPATGSLAGYEVPSNYVGPVPAGVYKSNLPFISQGRAPYDDFAPRAGFAWQPIGGNRLVVRGGGGIYYNLPGGALMDGDLFGNPPQSISVGTSTSSQLSQPFVPQTAVAGPAGSVGFPVRWANFTTGQASAITYAGPPQYMTVPAVYEWTLGTQYEFLPSWVVELGYVGSHGIHDLGEGDIPPFNWAQLAGGGAGQGLHCGYDGVPTDCITANALPSGASNIALRVPYLGLATSLGTLNYSATGAERYNGLNVTVRKTLSHGFQVNAAYSWSRAFENFWVGNPLADTVPGVVPTVSKYFLNTAYYPQRLSVSYTWNLPSGHFEGLMNKLVSGWTWSGVTIRQDGTPLGITDSSAATLFTNSGGGSLQAQYCPGMGISNIATSGSVTSKVLSGLTGGSGYLNGSKQGVFCSVPAYPTGANAVNGGFGTASLTPGILGPGQNDWDMTLAKATKVGGINENASLQFRAEFFNTFNHPQFSNPGVNEASTTTYGVITATSVNPRYLQFALKYVF